MLAVIQNLSGVLKDQAKKMSTNKNKHKTYTIKRLTLLREENCVHTDHTYTHLIYKNGETKLKFPVSKIK